jgi:hypothetical protein
MSSSDVRADPAVGGVEASAGGDAQPTRTGPRHQKKDAGRKWTIRTGRGGHHRKFATMRRVAAVGAVLVLLAAAGAGTWWAVSRQASSLPPHADPNAPGVFVTRSLQMPDPFVFATPSVDYLYTSGYGTSPPHVPVRAFSRFGQWRPVVEAMPQVPAWSNGWIWAPDVRKAAGRYVMWFASPDVQTQLPTGVQAKCVGVATSSSPLGPFTSPAPNAPICQAWGSIDPRTLSVDGNLYLYWKSDTNADTSTTIPTTIWAARLAPNGTQLVSNPVDILTAGRPWERALIEAPEMVRAAGRYYLFFSGSPSFKSFSGIGVAQCTGPLGPCRDSRTRPLLGSTRQLAGPSEESLFSQNGATWLLYGPATTSGHVLYRWLTVTKVAFAPSGPYVADPGTLPHTTQPGHGTPPRR